MRNSVDDLAYYLSRALHASSNCIYESNPTYLGSPVFDRAYFRSKTRTGEMSNKWLSSRTGVLSESSSSCSALKSKPCILPTFTTDSVLVSVSARDFFNREAIWSWTFAFSSQYVDSSPLESSNYIESHLSFSMKRTFILLLQKERLPHYTRY